MKTTTDRATVGRDALVQALNDQLHASRETLPKAANGRSIAPSDPRAAQHRKDIRQGRANPYGMLITIGECDLRDGVPFGEVVANLRHLIAYFEHLAVAGALRAAERPIMALMRTETKAQARADLAQLRLAESPECREALADVIREAEGHKQALTDLVTAGVRQLAVVRTQPQVAVGARRIALV